MKRIIKPAAVQRAVNTASRRLSPRPFIWAGTVFFILAVLLAFELSHLQNAHAASVTLKPYQRQFIDFLLPSVRAANRAVRLKREKILVLEQQLGEGKTLTTEQEAWLVGLAEHYKVVSIGRLTPPWLMSMLLQRVDTVPASLVLAQAINESAWGKSRFAKQANNYFGQWCFSEGCGLVPKRRAHDKHYQVARFASAQASVASYLHNLNSAKAYTVLRHLRLKQRALGARSLDWSWLKGWQLTRVRVSSMLLGLRKTFRNLSCNAMIGVTSQPSNRLSTPSALSLI